MNLRKSISSATASMSACCAVLLCPSIQRANVSYRYLVATKLAARKIMRDLENNESINNCSPKQVPQNPLKDKPKTIIQITVPRYK